MSKINWTAVAVFGIVVLVAFLVGASLLGGGWGYGPFGWIGMIFMWLIPW